MYENEMFAIPDLNLCLIWIKMENLRNKNARVNTQKIIFLVRVRRRLVWCIAIIINWKTPKAAPRK